MCKTQGVGLLFAGKRFPLKKHVGCLENGILASISNANPLLQKITKCIKQ